MNIGNKEAQNVIKGALTCCGKHLPAGEACSICAGPPKLYCSCIRCTQTCDTKTFTAVPAVEKKKVRSKKKKEEHVQLEAHVRKHFSNLPEEMVSDMAKVPDSALAQLPDGVKQRFGMSEEMLSNLSNQPHFRKPEPKPAEYLRGAVERVGDLSMITSAAAAAGNGRERTEQQSQQLAAAAASNIIDIAALSEQQFSSMFSRQAWAGDSKPAALELYKPPPVYKPPIASPAVMPGSTAAAAMMHGGGMMSPMMNMPAASAFSPVMSPMMSPPPAGLMKSQYIASSRSVGK